MSLAMSFLLIFELLPMMEVIAATRAVGKFGSEVKAVAAALTVSANEPFWSIPKMFGADINLCGNMG